MQGLKQWCDNCKEVKGLHNNCPNLTDPYNMPNNTKKEDCQHFLHNNHDVPCPDCPSPQSPLSEKRCNQCKLEGNYGKCDRKDCCGYNFSSSNEDWEIRFDRLDSAIWDLPVTEKVLNEIKDFIRQQRLEAQRELVEKIRKASIWKLVPNTPRMVMCKDSELDELLCGLLPKITE